MTVPSNRFLSDNPLKPARNVVRYLDAVHAHPDRYLLLYHRGVFFVWTGSYWRGIDEETLEAEVYKTFENAVFETINAQTHLSEYHDFDINPSKLTALMRGIQNKVLIDRDVNTPVWLNGNIPVEREPVSSVDGLPMTAREMIACRNGLLHTRSRTFFNHTPRLFNRTAVDFDYLPNATPPVEWTQFLYSIWPDDQESMDTLQEWFGYCLTSRTDLQKMLMLYGPRRAGKGTIIHILTSLLGGTQSVTTTSLASLNTQFGLGHLEDKVLAIMPDVRFRSRDDGVAVERLLSITGEDDVLVDKKHVQAYAARLSTRILLSSNELPKMTDESGALRSRIILLKFTETFLGREDISLRERLTDPYIMSGILNWSLIGLDRLFVRGFFIQPKSAYDDLGVITELSSPTLSFIEDCCVIAPHHMITRDQLFALWCAWCAQTRTFTGDRRVFARNIRAAVPSIQDHRPLENGVRPRYYRGIGINTEGARMLSTLSWGQSASFT